MQKEIDLILNQFPNCRKIDSEGTITYYGEIGDHQIVVAQCGIGKVNAALRTCRIIEQYNPELVINTGVAGGVDASMPVGSILIAERVAYHDVWCGPGTEYGAADGCPLYFHSSDIALSAIKNLEKEFSSKFTFGLLCSGDKFISTKEEVSKIKQNFPDALGCDMESAAICQTCYKFNVPSIVVRVMSDTPGAEDNISQYKNFWNEAPARTFEIVKHLIDSL